MRKPISLLDQIARDQRKWVNGYAICETNDLFTRVPFGDNLFRAKRAARRVRAEQEWFESLIQHAPSVGSFYEGLLRSEINELLPSSKRLGEGFVYSTHEELASKQLDLIVYEDSDQAPLYRRGDFVIVTSSGVRAVGECKKTLTAADVDETIAKLLFINLGTDFHGDYGCRPIHIFAFKASMSTKALQKRIAKSLSAALVTDQEVDLVRTSRGEVMRAGVRFLNLPQFYFMDRPEFVRTRLVWKDERPERIDVQVLEQFSGPEESLAVFLLSMSEFGESLDKERNFFHADLFKIGNCEKVPCGVNVYQELTTEEMSVRWPGWREELVVATANAKQDGFYMTGVRFSARQDLSKLNGFGDLGRMESFEWIAEPISPDAQSPAAPAELARPRTTQLPRFSPSFPRLSESHRTTNFFELYWNPIGSGQDSVAPLQSEIMAFR